MTASMSIHGSCLCRGVRYEIDGDLALPGYCHCSICRKVHGSAFGAYANARSAEFRWTAGEDLVSKYESSPGSFRCFCSRCGSPLAAMVANEPEFVGVTLGTLDDAAGVQPIAHIFVGSKAPWYTITDDLMQFEEWPPGMGTADPKSK